MPYTHVDVCLVFGHLRNESVDQNPHGERGHSRHRTQLPNLLFRKGIHVFYSRVDMLHRNSQETKHPCGSGMKRQTEMRLEKTE